MNKKEKYEQIKTKIIEDGGKTGEGKFLVFGKNGSLWTFRVDEEKLFDESENYHSVVSEVTGVGTDLMPITRVPTISIEEISNVHFEKGYTNPGCFNPAIGRKNKFQKFEKLIELLISDDEIWTELYIKEKSEEYWNNSQFAQYKTFQSMFEEWKLYGKFNEIRTETGLFSAEIPPFMFYHDHIETEISRDSWIEMFEFIQKHNFVIQGDEITIQCDGFRITFKIQMMPETHEESNGEKMQISTSIISFDTVKNVAINTFSPSKECFEKVGYCSIEDWEHWMEFAFEEYINDQFSGTELPENGDEFNTAIQRIISMFEQIISKDFIRKYAMEATINIFTRHWQMEEWPDPHFEDSYTMQDYQDEKKVFRNKIRKMFEEDFQ